MSNHVLEEIFWLEKFGIKLDEFKRKKYPFLNFFDVLNKFVNGVEHFF